jgi:hypothetical protein
LGTCKVGSHRYRTKEAPRLDIYWDSGAVYEWRFGVHTYRLNSNGAMSPAAALAAAAHRGETNPIK